MLQFEGTNPWTLQVGKHYRIGTEIYKLERPLMNHAMYFSVLARHNNDYYMISQYNPSATNTTNKPLVSASEMRFESGKRGGRMLLSDTNIKSTHCSVVPHTGLTLGDLLESGSLNRNHALSLCGEIEKLHSQNHIFGDLYPTNIEVMSDGCVKLLNTEFKQPLTQEAQHKEIKALCQWFSSFADEGLQKVLERSNLTLESLRACLILSTVCNNAYHQVFNKPGLAKKIISEYNSYDNQLLNGVSGDFCQMSKQINQLMREEAGDFIKQSTTSNFKSKFAQIIELRSDRNFCSDSGNESTASETDWDEPRLGDR